MPADPAGGLHALTPSNEFAPGGYSGGGNHIFRLGDGTLRAIRLSDCAHVRTSARSRGSRDGGETVAPLAPRMKRRTAWHASRLTHLAVLDEVTAVECARGRRSWRAYWNVWNVMEFPVRESPKGRAAGRKAIQSQFFRSARPAQRVRALMLRAATPRLRPCRELKRDWVLAGPISLGGCHENTDGIIRERDRRPCFFELRERLQPFVRQRRDGRHGG